MKLDTIQHEALHLPVQERAQLAHRLLESLDDLSETETEQLWLLEAQRRAREIDDGVMQLVSAEELERRVQAQLK